MSATAEKDMKPGKGGGVLDPCLGYRGAAPSFSCEDPL